MNSKYIFSLVILISLMMEGCAKTHPSVSATDTLQESADEYHADYDIAMTLRSIADAIAVGEPLDTAEYNFEGILTDGMGHPLYTDIQGAPGLWEIDVLNPTTAVIRNIYLGDLLPDNLLAYLESSMTLSAHNRIDPGDFDDDDETEMYIYDFDGGYIRFENRAAIAPNGLEGPLVSIIASRDLPEGMQ